MSDMDPLMLASLLRVESTSLNAANARAARWKKRYEEQRAIVARVQALVDTWEGVQIDDEWEAADCWSDAPKQLRTAVEAS